MQESSGLEEEARHPVGAALYLEQARQLLGRLAKTPVTYRSFAPRRVLYWLLREVLEGGERVEYADLKWRAERFGLLVVRPDGTPKYWYVNSGKFEQMMEQAGRQSKLAQRLGLPVAWHVADAKVANFLRKIFENRGWNNMAVHHAPLAR